MRAWLMGALALAAPLAGCLTGPSTPAFQPAVLADGRFTLDLDVHIVAAGFEAFDAELLGANLRQPIAPLKWIRADTTGDLTPEPLQYRVNYVVHEAPDAFAEELFAYARSIAIGALPDAFLANYDRAGPHRICPSAASEIERTVFGDPPCREMQRIEGAKIEAWIAAHRARHGLAWPGAGYTVFLLDSYSKGYLPKDNYHQYYVDDGTTDANMRNLRAWGGTFDFVWLDVGAAPNPVDFRPWGNYSREGSKLTGLEDRPIWDYDLGKRRDLPKADCSAPDAPCKYQRGAQDRDANAFYWNLAQNVYDAARILWARAPIYPFEYAQRYVLPMYVIVDPNAHTNPQSPLSKVKPADFEKHTDVAGLRRAFQELAPWAQVDLTVTYVYLPDDDAALNAAVQDAKNRFTTGQVDFGILKKYFRENWRKYVPDVPGARVYPTFAFSLEFPTTSLFAYSDGDELGNSWGVFFNAADLFVCGRPARPVCFTEELFTVENDWWLLWNAILSHELGHSFGLTHTHDAPGLDGKGYTTYEVNWLWDSTASVMTYRHSFLTYDRFDKDLLLRAHAVNLATEILERPGVADGARAHAQRALDDVRAGAWRSGFEAAREALRLAGAAPQEDLGEAGAPQRTPIRLPGSYYVTGNLHNQPLPGPRAPPPLPDLEGVNYASFPIQAPAGTSALALEYREAAAPTHARWSAFVVILNARGEAVTGLYNNGYDKVVLLDVDRCPGGCTGRLYAMSGANVAYDVTVTPYLG